MPADYIADYAEYLSKEKRASANTVSSYLRDIHQFAEYLSAQAGIPPEKAEQEKRDQSKNA